MPAPAPRTMTADEFLVWRLDREETWEFVGGVPRLKFDNGPQMMAGGTWNHALVASNLIAALRPRLRGGPCRPVGSDLAVRVDRGALRQPDVTVECGRPGGDDLTAVEPRAIFEVLSPSTRRLDLLLKADEYRRLSSLAHLVLLEPDRARALVWSREGERWSVQEVEGLATGIALPALGVTLPMTEVYEDVELEPSA